MPVFRDDSELLAAFRRGDRNALEADDAPELEDEDELPWANADTLRLVEQS